MIIVFSYWDGIVRGMGTVLAVLDPSIKIFISLAAIAGPLSILGIILLLKKIEKNNPERIRWR